MKTRDKLNTLENYQKVIMFHQFVIESDLEKIEDLLRDERNGIQKSKIDNQQVIHNTKRWMARDLFKIFKATYSAGYPISE
ncbi:TPA: DUF1910 domain-containing protein, partial [Streptococcus equi subsp. zooepidemicus]|nr:DUF1910 domain-containing protein [Streptococcus equi subsp. zooepidemicus]